MARIDRKWQIVMVLFFVAGLNYADRSAISAVIPLVRSDLGLSDIAIASIGSVFLWAYALGSPAAGFFADRLSRSNMIFWSLMGWSAATVATAFVNNLNVMLATRVFLGIAECAYLPAAVALVADHHDSSTRGTAMALHLVGLNAGLIGGGAVCGYLGEHFGWRSAFLALGFGGILLAPVVRLVLRDGERAAAAPVCEASVAGRNLLTLFRNTTADAILIEAMLISTGTWMFFNWLPLYFKETYDMSLAAAGFTGTFMIQIAAVFGSMFGGVISDRFSRGAGARRVLLLSLCYFCAAPFLTAFVTRPALGVISAAIFFYSLFRSIGSANEHPILCDILPRNLRSTAVGCMNTMNCLSGGVGVMAAGLLKKDWGLAGAFGGVSLLVFVAAMVVLAAYFLQTRAEPRGSALPVLELYKEKNG
jgi:predicted MFS family arabinose efflux permease